MFCTNCGKEIPVDASFCPQCGRRLNNAEATLPDIPNKLPEIPQSDTKECIISQQFIDLGIRGNMIIYKEACLFTLELYHVNIKAGIFKRTESRGKLKLRKTFKFSQFLDYKINRDQRTFATSKDWIKLTGQRSSNEANTSLNIFLDDQTDTNINIDFGTFWNYHCNPNYKLAEQLCNNLASALEYIKKHSDDKPLCNMDNIQKNIVTLSSKNNNPNFKQIGCGCLVLLILFAIFINVITNLTQSKSKKSPSEPPVENKVLPASQKDVTSSSSSTSQQSSKNDTPNATAKVENVPEPLPKIEKEYKAPILANAISSYPETEKELKKQGYPKLLKNIGLSNIKKANKLIPLAAEKASKSKSCDAVEIADISTKSTRDNLIFYVRAKNGTKFYFTEEDLKENSPAKSEQEQLAPLLKIHEAMAEEVIKSKLPHPSTYNRHFFGEFNSRTTPSCNEITIEFSAKNAFNLELTYVAIVQFDKNNKVVGFHMQEKQ